MHPGLPAWRHLASQNVKRAYRYQNNKLWSYKRLAGPVGTSEIVYFMYLSKLTEPGRVAQSVGHPTRKSGVLGSIPGLATYFRFSFRFFKKGSCQLLAKVCARSTG